MLSSHTVGFKRPDNSNLANLTPGLCILVGLGVTSIAILYQEYIYIGALAVHCCKR